MHRERRDCARSSANDHCLDNSQPTPAEIFPSIPGDFISEMNNCGLVLDALGGPTNKVGFGAGVFIIAPSYVAITGP